MPAAAADDRRVRAVDVVGEPDARAEVVLVLLERDRGRIRRVPGERDAVGFGLGRLRELLVLVAQTEVQRQTDCSRASCPATNQL